MKPQLQKLVSFLFRHKRLWITIICVILGVSGGLSWTSWKHQEAVRPEVDAVRTEVDKAWSILAKTDRGQGFGSRLDTIALRRSQGDASYRRHFLTSARTDYLAILTELRELEHLEQNRLRAIKSRDSSEIARTEGLRAFPRIIIFPSWENALALEKMAAKAFEEAFFDQAAEKWSDAADIFKKTVTTSLQKQKVANDARTEWRRKRSLYSTSWLEKYATTAWKEFSNHENATEHDFESGKFEEAATSYQILSRQFSALTRQAKEEQDKERLQTATHAYATSLQAIRSQNGGLQKDSDTWRSVQKLETEAEKDATAGHFIQSAWRYEAAERLLQKEILLSSWKGSESDSTNSSTSTHPTHRAFEGSLAELAMQGKLQFESGDLEGAATSFQSILDTSPCHAMALANLGVVRYQQKQVDKASELLRAALAADPLNPLAASLLGIILNTQSEYAEAMDVLSLATLIQPKNPENHNQLGTAWLKLGKLREAESELLQAIRLDPNLGSAHYNLAVVFTSQEPPSLELAKKHYKRARELGMEANLDLENTWTPKR